MFLTPRIANERFPAIRKKPLEERENARWTEMKRGLRKGLEAYLMIVGFKQRCGL